MISTGIRMISAPISDGESSRRRVLRMRVEIAVAIRACPYLVQRDARVERA